MGIPIEEVVAFELKPTVPNVHVSDVRDLRQACSLVRSGAVRGFFYGPAVSAPDAYVIQTLCAERRIAVRRVQPGHLAIEILSWTRGH